MASVIRRVGSFASDPVTQSALNSSPLADHVASATAAAVELARRRLATRFTAETTHAMGRYFDMPRVHRWSGMARPMLTAVDLLADVCSSPRTVAVGEKAAGLQVELRSPDGAVGREDLGDPIEPGADVLQLVPDRVRTAALRNASVEVRQFDRQCPSWGPLADDVAAVSGADLFVKLFMAGGERSVNGWHRDGSDVVAMVLVGSKRFSVAEQNDDEGVRPVVDEVLHPGDAVLLPRGRPHCATPTEDFSALLSLGLMRVGDWPYRQVPPTHLGFRNYPRSAETYRLCLRPHSAATPEAASEPAGRELRTRLPGGIAVVDGDRDVVTFVAAGSVYVGEERALRLLAAVHAHDSLLAEQAAGFVGLSVADCLPALSSLIDAGLVRVGSTRADPVG